MLIIQVSVKLKCNYECIELHNLVFLHDDIHIVDSEKKNVNIELDISTIILNNDPFDLVEML